MSDRNNDPASSPSRPQPSVSSGNVPNAAGSPAPQTAPTDERSAEGLMQETQESRELLDLAVPQLYRRNLFRVLGLSITATPGQVRRQQQRQALQRKLETAQDDNGSGPFALDPPATEEEIRRALDRLNDPRTRLLDEIFWFWPTDGSEAPDPALQALERGQVSQARAIWTSLVGQKDHAELAAHNLAILAHLTALEAEMPRPDSDHHPQGSAPAQMWAEAFAHWRVVVQGEEFWSRVRDRIRQLNDARLTTAMVPRIRGSLQKVLLTINAQMALAAAERGDAPTATRHLEVIQHTTPGDGLAREVLRESLVPIRSHLKVLCEAADGKANQDPEHANAVTRDLIAKTTPLLKIVDMILPASDTLRQGLHDYVASMALGCQVRYGNKTEDWDDSLALLEVVLSLAAGQALTDRIRDNLQRVKGNMELSRCWFCGKNRADQKSRYEVKMYGDITRTPLGGVVMVQWRHATLSVPRCASCAAAHARQKLWSILSGLLVWGFGSIDLAAAIAFAAQRGNDEGAWVGVVGMLLWMAAFPVGLLVAWSTRPVGVKSKGAYREFPRVKELLAKGWEFGEKPNTQG